MHKGAAAGSGQSDVRIDLMTGRRGGDLFYETMTDQEKWDLEFKIDRLYAARDFNIMGHDYEKADKITKQILELQKILEESKKTKI